MKIQCDVCERAAAAVLCCADEAALCWGCDEKVHAANKLAGKHQRVPLLLTESNSSSSSSSSSSSQIPICDICQEKAGYFFCLEDRALLCRQCDVAIHTVSPYASSHQRFLITGVRVALQHHHANDSTKNSSCSNGNSTSSNSNNSSNPLSKKLHGATSGFAAAECLKPQWPWSEFLDGFELDRHHGISEPGSSG